MRAVLVDDERLARKELTRLLAAHPEVELVGEAANVAEGVALIDAEEPDLVFLDIEMPDGTGFALLERLERTPHVIFTTAFDQHAVKAFEVNALDYLLKPVEPSRLKAALEKVPVSSRPRGAPLDQVFVRDGDRCWFLKLSTVPLLESDGNYTRVHVEGRQPMINRSLHYLEERLDPAVFFRASRQFLINLSAITAMEPGPEGRLVARLTTGREIEMSRRQSQRFKDLMSP